MKRLSLFLILSFLFVCNKILSFLFVCLYDTVQCLLYSIMALSNQGVANSQAAVIISHLTWLYWLQDRDILCLIGTLSTILQHFTHTMKPRAPLLLADGNLRCGMYPAGKVAISYLVFQSTTNAMEETNVFEILDFYLAARYLRSTISKVIYLRKTGETLNRSLSYRGLIYINPIDNYRKSIPIQCRLPFNACLLQY